MEKFPFLSEVFDSINEGIYILNRQGDYIYCNSAFLKMVGATRDDVLELNAFRLVPEGQVSISVAVMAFEQKKKLSVVNNVCTPKGYHYRQLAERSSICWWRWSGWTSSKSGISRRSWMRIWIALRFRAWGTQLGTGRRLLWRRARA